MHYVSEKRTNSLNFRNMRSVSIAKSPDRLWAHPASYTEAIKVSTPGLTRQGREINNSSRARVQNVWSCPSTSPYLFMAWSLSKYRDVTMYCYKP
jgi:hypothetical protein